MYPNALLAVSTAPTTPLQIGEHMQILRRTDRLFNTIVSQYESLCQRIDRIEDGIEIIDPVTYEAIRLSHSQLKREIHERVQNSLFQP